MAQKWGRYVAFFGSDFFLVFVILVERWSEHDAWWGSSQSAMKIKIEPGKFRHQYKVQKTFRVRGKN